MPFVPIVNEGSERGSKSDTESSMEIGTTLMLRNIPNKYTRDMILEEIHEAGFALDVGLWGQLRGGKRREGKGNSEKH